MYARTQGRDLQLKVSEMWEDPVEWVELLNACAAGASDEPEPAPEPEPASAGVQISEGVPPAAISAEDDLLGVLAASAGPPGMQTRESGGFSFGVTLKPVGPRG